MEIDPQNPESGPAARDSQPANVAGTPEAPSAPEFNQFAGTYDDHLRRAIAFSGQDSEFFTQIKAAHLLRLMRARFGDVDRLRLLDVGCGVGLTDGYLIPHVGTLLGVDVADAAIEQARARHPQGQFQAYDGERLPHEDASVDVAFAICVMHHVPRAQWPRFMQEMQRVVKPGGLVAIYEHNPLNPLTRLTVARCEFDAHAVLLSPRTVRRLMRGAELKTVVGQYILFFPWRGGIFRGLESRLGWLPLGAQYVVAGTRR